MIKLKDGWDIVNDIIYSINISHCKVLLLVPQEEVLMQMILFDTEISLY